MWVSPATVHRAMMAVPPFVGTRSQRQDAYAIFISNTNGDCSVCHNTTNFADAFVDHAGADVLGKRCDPATTGPMQPARMPRSTTFRQSRIAVSVTYPGTFTPAVFNHTGIVDNCASCHNGTDATGMDAIQPPTHSDRLRTARSAIPPRPLRVPSIEHQGILNDCASCHDGNTATGKAQQPCANQR